MDVNKHDPLPDHFDNLVEAAEFWDTHSAADYWDEMEEFEVEFRIQHRLFLVPVKDQVYFRIKRKAEREGRSLSEIVNDLLLRELA